MKKSRKKMKKIILSLLFLIMIVIDSYFNFETQGKDIENNKTSYEISNIPEYYGQSYIEINNNNPEFTDEDLQLEEDYYSALKGGKVRNGNGKNMLGKSE